MSTDVSVDLRAIPEIEEINQIIESGLLSPTDFIEADLPVLSSAQRAALQTFLQNLEDTDKYVTGYENFGDKEMIIIVPIVSMFTFLAKFGVVGLA
jgi:ABC-type maltose transport system permease subunit